MPIPTPRKDEDRSKFMSRCMSDPVMRKDYKNNQQRVAVCMSKATEDMSKAEAMDFVYSFEEFGYTEEVDENNFYCPREDEYATAEEIDLNDSDFEDYDISVAKPGLWENIRKKREREGKDYKPAKPGDKDRPDPEAWKKAQSAEYQGRKVTLNKPFRTPDGPKKFSVYTKNDKGNIVKVNFGSPDMEIKRDSPERRKSFRARHGCDKNPGPKWKAKWWSCQWSWK